MPKPKLHATMEYEWVDPSKTHTDFGYRVVVWFGTERIATLEPIREYDGSYYTRYSVDEIISETVAPYLARLFN